VKVLAPMLPVEPLPALQVIVTQWRKGRGARFVDRQGVRRMARYGWSAAEAADLAGMPVRTLYDWRTSELVEPTMVSKEHEIEEPIYCSADLLTLRLVRDLDEAGVAREILRAAAAHCSQVFGYCDGTSGQWSLSATVELFPSWFVPADVATASLLSSDSYFGGMVFVDSDGGCRELEENPDMPLIEYPAARRVAELQLRVNAWWGEVRPVVPSRLRPPWMC
jgi:hypothetical protein